MSNDEIPESAMQAAREWQEKSGDYGTSVREVARAMHEYAQEQVKDALLRTKEVKVLMPPMQPWELELQKLLKNQFELGYAAGRASKP